MLLLFIMIVSLLGTEIGLKDLTMCYQKWIETGLEGSPVLSEPKILDKFSSHYMLKTCGDEIICAGYLQELVYKLSKVGQAIDNNDLSAASSVLGGSTNADWVKKANKAFTKVTLIYPD